MKRFAVLLAVMLLLSLTTSSLLAQSAAQENAEPTLSELFASLPQSRTADGGFVVGQPDAPITIVQFADYACPHCQDYRSTIDPILQIYLPTGQIKYELRILPTAGGQATYYAGLVQECANHQRLGMYWQAYEALYSYATVGNYRGDVAQRLADDFGLDYNKLIRCTRSASQVATDTNLANQLGVQGTPGIMVRYGDGDPQFITLDGETFSAGGVPYPILAQVIQTANALPVNI